MPGIRCFQQTTSALWSANLLCAAVLICLAASPTRCFAGGGPENVFLVVNSAKPDSLTIANHYISLRKVPTTNVFYVDWADAPGVSTGRSFCKTVLMPTLAEIQSRKLNEQIDYVVYSSGFPWRVNFNGMYPGNHPQHLPAWGSISGATYLYTFLQNQRKEIFALNNNFYCLPSRGGITISRGFRNQYRWLTGGRRVGSGGLSYMLTSVLGVTQDHGNTVPEIIGYLRRAVEADGTKPSGSVYFMKHDGPRSKPRHTLYPAAARELTVLGVRAQVLEGKMPKGKKDVMGIVTGAPKLNVANSGCRFLPGAFCDNLTSAGAQFRPKNTQTCVSEFLRAGATAGCGTVVEPLAIRQKFPLPDFFVHYANGCSVAESFYQSVSGPYQQLLMGDPLCQPWADIPTVRADELANGKMLRGHVEITPRVEDHEKPIQEYEIYVDGIRTQKCKPGKKIRLDTTTFADGYHELRIVARDDTPIETQGRLIAGVTFKNGRDAIGLTTKQKNVLPGSKTIVVDVSSTIDVDVDVFCNSLSLGTVAGGNGSLKIAKEQLGSGPVELYAVCESLRSQPLRIKLAR